ncbi:hypothetical protein DFP73DRAFT_609499 [Morchella snyderi]|nr:hypothetical protein DFP73DRAFT_609499 [Morchella snyderi]
MHTYVPSSNSITASSMTASSITTFSFTTFSITTFSITTFSITTFSITTFSITTFSITTFSITTFSITTFSIRIKHFIIMTSPISPESTLLHEELKEIIFTLAAYVTRLKDDRSKIRFFVAKMNSYLVDLGFDIDNNALGGAKPSSELYAILQDKERAQLRLAGMDCDYEQLGIRLEKLIEAERVLKQRLM